jgi:hypothetical protein
MPANTLPYKVYSNVRPGAGPRFHCAEIPL